MVNGISGIKRYDVRQVLVVVWVGWGGVGSGTDGEVSWQWWPRMMAWDGGLRLWDEVGWA